jgi:gentisate 1,2-dioxygenase
MATSGAEATRALFVDRSGAVPARAPLWPAIVVPKEAIEAEAQRLAAAPRPANGRRTSLVVHPLADPATPGLAPGIRVSIEVLLPGEATAPIRHSSTRVGFCISGGGEATVGGRRIRFAQYDVWNVPAMATWAHRNDGRDLQVVLAYSNAPLLEKLNVHLVEEGEAVDAAFGKECAAAGGGEACAATASDEPGPATAPSGIPPGAFQLDEAGAYLMPYERLIDPVAVASRPLHFPWRAVKGHLDELQALGPRYTGRRLYLLYNPATGRTNGTTASFFATMCVRPPRIVDRPHRHAAAAINYYFSGSGRSTVEGSILEWKAGDLMLSAPGWAVHNHASHGEAVYELTVQDSPLHIAMESLLWQEDLKGPVRVLGAGRGFVTNRERV